MHRDVTVILLFSVTSFLFLSNFGLLGPVGRFVSDLMFGLCGLTAYLLPAFLLFTVLYYVVNEDDPMTLTRIAGAAGLFVIAGIACELFAGTLPGMQGYDIESFYIRCSENRTGGGILGGSLAYLFYSLFKMIGSVLLLLILATLCLVLVSRQSIIDLVSAKAEDLRELHEQRRAMEEEYRLEQEQYRLEHPEEFAPDIPKHRMPRSNAGRRQLPDEYDGYYDRAYGYRPAEHPDEAGLLHYRGIVGDTMLRDFPSEAAGEYDDYEQSVSNLQDQETAFASGKYMDRETRDEEPVRRPMPFFNGKYYPELPEVEEERSSRKDIGSGSADHLSDLYADKKAPENTGAVKEQAAAEYEPQPEDEDYLQQVEDPAGWGRSLPRSPSSDMHEIKADEFFDRPVVMPGQSAAFQESYAQSYAKGYSEAANALSNYSDGNVFDKSDGSFTGNIEGLLLAPFEEEGMDSSVLASSHLEAGFASASDNTYFAQDNSVREEAQRQAEEQARMEAAQKQAEEQARMKAAQKQAEEQARMKAAQRQAEEQARREAAEKQAEEQARQDAASATINAGGLSSEDAPSMQSEPESSAAPAAAASDKKSVNKPREYVFPPLSLLKDGKHADAAETELELRETAARLQTTLKTFGVNVKITDISQGPAVTRYELLPEMGVKVSKIVGLQDDIKLQLAATDIRMEAPIPGKSAIGIEVPNKSTSVVSLKEIISTDEFRHHSSRLAFGVGKDIAGKPVITDIAKMPHVLIAGATGSGKSVCINTIIMSILFHADPREVKLIMIDPKVVELSVYNGIPHLMIPVVTDPQKASAALNWAVAEMDSRYRKFADCTVRDIKGYNALLREREEALASGVSPDEAPGMDDMTFMPQLVVIVDELADLMMVAKNDVETAICRLAQLARAAGIHLIIATQRPSVDVITGLIKANMPSRIAFSVSSGVDSRTILDMYGAEKLLGKGDMLFYPQGMTKPARVQGAFVSDDEVNAVVRFVKKNNPVEKTADDLEKRIESMADHPSAGSQGSPEGDSGNSRYDELFEKAGMFIIEKDNASIGLLQRMFRIGFNRAARIMDQLCEAGVVGDAEGTKSRKILMTQMEFENFCRNEL